MWRTAVNKTSVLIAIGTTREHRDLLKLEADYYAGQQDYAEEHIALTKLRLVELELEYLDRLLEAVVRVEKGGVSEQYHDAGCKSEE